MSRPLENRQVVADRRSSSMIKTQDQVCSIACVDDLRASNPYTSEPAIYWIGLDTKFPVEEPIPSDRLNSVTIPEDVTPFGVNQSLVAGPLFYTNDSIYVVAGMGDAANNVLPVFDTTTEDWSAVTVEGGNFNTHNRLQSVVASDQRTGLSFMIGGDLGRFHFGMIRFDASDEASPQWTNETTNDVSGGIEVPSILEGSMVYLPMGEAGVLLAIGGYDVRTPLSL